MFCSTKPAKKFSIVTFFGTKIFKFSLSPYSTRPNFKKNLFFVFWVFDFFNIQKISHAFNYVFSNFLLYHSIEHAKAECMTSSDFWKNFVLCPKNVAYKIYMQFFGLFWRIFACAKFFSIQMDFKKNRTTSCTPSLHALSNGKKKILKKHS